MPSLRSSTAAAFLVVALAACQPPKPGPKLPDDNLGDSTARVPYSHKLTATGGTGTLTYQAAGLPPGFQMDSGGTLSGTATAAGDFAISVTVTDSEEKSDSKVYALRVYPALGLRDEPLPDAVAGTLYAASLPVMGGKPPLAFVLMSGSLPPGISLDSATGALSGTPPSAGTSSFAVQAQDANGALAAGTFSLRVGAALAISTSQLAQGNVGSPYSDVVQASGGRPPIQYAVSSGTLPDGLSLSSDGVLSGTPTRASTFTFTVSATDASRAVAARQFNVRVLPLPPPRITTASLPGVLAGASYSFTLQAQDGEAPYAWTLASGSLPSGFSLSTSGVLSGTATVTGSYPLEIALTDGNGQTVSRAFTLSVVTVLQITTAGLADAYVGSGYSATLAAGGGLAPFAWTVGALPPGLGASASTGVVSGTPTASGSFAVTVSLADTSNQTASKTLSLEVYDPPALTTASVAPGAVGSAYAQQLQATGGKAPLAFSFTGSLPAGLSLSSTGALTGTPTTAGPFTFTAQVTDANGRTASRVYSGQIYAGLTVTTFTLPDGYVGQGYNQQLSAVGGTTPYSWTLVSGSLPNGLSISSTGALTGTPTATGSSSFSVRVTDSSTPPTQSAPQAITLTVYAPPALTTASLDDGYVGSAYSKALVGSGGKTPYTFAVTSGTLPSGLSLSSAGLISGTPTASGTATLGFTLMDANGQTATRSGVTLAVYPAVVIAAATLPTGYLTVPYSTSLNASGGKGTLTFSPIGTLPPGLALSTSGAITGTPTTSGSFSFDVQVADTNGKSDSKTYGITVAPALAVTTASLADAYATYAYSGTVSATGGKPPYSFTFTGSLPAGLSLSTSGALTGTPTTAGNSSFTVQVKDANNTTASQAFTLAVYDPVNLVTTAYPDGYVSDPYSATSQVTGGKAPFTWSVSNGALPPGLTLSASTGAISGTPTTTGTTNFTVTVTDINGAWYSRPLSITVYTLPTITTASPLPEGYAGDPYSATVAGSGGKGGLTFSITSGALPPGLTLSASGVIGTTLGAAGNGQTYNFTATAADANGKLASKALAITTWIAPSVGNSSLTVATEGISYRRSPGVPEVLQAVNGKPLLVFAASGLPAGLTISSGTGVISGIPAQGAAGTYNVTLTVTDASSKSGSKTLPLVVKAAQPIPFGGTDGVEPAGSPVTDVLTVFVIDSSGRPAQNLGVRIRKNGAEFNPVKQALTDVSGKAFFSGLGCNGISDTVDVTVNGSGFANMTMAKVNAALVTMAPLEYPTPIPRYAAAATFDSVVGRVVMSGGFTGNVAPSIRSACVDDVVKYQGTSWSELVIPGMTTSPPARGNAAFAYGGGVDVLFGGVDCFANAPLGDTWEFNTVNNTWTRGGQGPGALGGAMMTINGSGDGVLLFGGYDGAAYHDELWNYQSSTHTWSAVTPLSYLPEARSNGGAAYDAATAELWICGGSGASGVLSDCWSYAPAPNAWTPQPSLPQARLDFGMAFGGWLYVFGGRNAGGADLDDLLFYDGSAWQTVAVPAGAPRPSARSLASLTYDAGSGKLVLMGGLSQTSGVLGDTWTYDTTNGWVLRSATPAPVGAFVSGSISGKNATDSYARVTVNGASGYTASQVIQLTGGTGAYSFSEVPAGDTVEVVAVNEDRGLSYPANPSRFWSYFSSGLVSVGAAGSTATVNIAFPAGPLPLTSATGTLALPSDWRSASISGNPRQQRSGFSAAVNGGFALSGGTGYRFDFFAPAAPSLETSYLSARNDEPNGCETSNVYWASGMAAGAQGTVTFVDGPRLMSPGLSICTPAGSGVRYERSVGIGGSPQSVAIGDLNGDGLPDLATANRYENTVSVAFGEPAGTFGAQGGPDFVLLTTSINQPTAVAIADLDGDGRGELLVTNMYNAPSNGTLTVHKWSSGTSFSPPTPYTVGQYPMGLAVGDLSGDGKPDAVVVNYGSGTITPFVNNGSGALVAQPAVSVPTGASSATAVALGDVAGSGAVDVVVANFYSDNVVVLTGNGAGGFTPFATLAAGNHPQSVAIGDLNNDSRRDLVIANEGSDDLYLYFNSSTGFGTAAVLALGSNPMAAPGAVAIGELTGDAYKDLAVSVSTTNELRVYRNNGNNTFSLYDTDYTDASPGPLALGDVVLDGKLDVAVACTDANAVDVFSQLTPLPTASEGTYSFSAASGARMFWVNRGPSQLAIDWEYVSRGAPGANAVVFPLPSTLAPSRPAPVGQRVGWDIGMYNYPAGSTFSYDNFRWRDLRQDAPVFVGSQGHAFIRQ